MKSKLAVLGDAMLVQGFRLAGVEDAFLVSEAEFAGTLEKMLARPEYGVLVVPERMLNALEWRLKKRLATLAYPVIVGLPSAGEKSEAGDEIRQLIKRALGFDLGAK